MNVHMPGGEFRSPGIVIPHDRGDALVYSKIDSRFWDDEKVLALSPDARYLMLYLLTTKHRNVLGCYQLPRAYALEDIQMPEDRFALAWDELLGSGMVLYESKTRMLLLKNFLRYNPIENPNQVKGAISKLEGLPKSELFRVVYQHLKGLMMDENKTYLSPLLEALKKLLSGQSDTKNKEVFANPSETLSGTVPQTLTETLSKPIPQPVYSNSIQITNNSIQDKNVNGRASAAMDILPAGFFEFWEVYPRKVKKQDAVKAWSQVKAKDHIDAIMTRLALFIDSPEWQKNNGQFVPYPASWLRARRWEDEQLPGVSGRNVLEELYREAKEAEFHDTN